MHHALEVCNLGNLMSILKCKGIFAEYIFGYAPEECFILLECLMS